MQFEDIYKIKKFNDFDIFYVIIWYKMVLKKGRVL